MSIINYFGGKRKQSEWIHKFIPKNSKTYVEVFGGSMSLYFNQDFSTFDIIVYNDVNTCLTNMLICFKTDFNKCKTLIEIPIELTKEFKDDFYNKYIKNFITFNTPRYDICDKFIKFFCCNYNSMMFSSYSNCSNRRLKTIINKLNNNSYPFNSKINNISFIENLDFKVLIEKYDSNDTLFYVDPPYKINNKSTTSKQYACENYFNEYSHKELFNILDKIKGKFILSYYMFDELKLLYNSNKFFFISKNYLNNSSHCSVINEEILIFNYNPKKLVNITKRDVPLLTSSI